MGQPSHRAFYLDVSTRARTLREPPTQLSESTFKTPSFVPVRPPAIRYKELSWMKSGLFLGYATWETHGAKILERMAVKESSRFADLCSRLIPRDVQLSLQTRLPGNRESDDWQALMEVPGAVKAALPDDTRKP